MPKWHPRLLRSLAVRTTTFSVLLSVAVLAVAVAAIAGSSAFKPPPFTVPPAGAFILKANPGPKMVDPFTKQAVVLPFWNALPVPAGPVGDASKTYTVCVSHSLFHPFPLSQKSSAALEAKRHPNVKLLYYNTNNDPLQQVRDLNQCLNRKVDGVLVYPHSVGPLTPEIEKLAKAGIPVVGMERTVATNKFLSWVYLDTQQELKLLTKGICAAVHNQGKVVEMPGTLGSSPQITRHGYFVQWMSRYCPKVQLSSTPATDFGAGTGYSVGLSFLRSPASSGVGAIFVDSNGAGEGLVKAEEQVGKKIPIFGIDADCKEIGLIQQGKIAGAVDHNPLHGDVALRLLLMHLNGKTPPHYVLEEPTFLITKANAANALPTCWGPK